MGSLSYRFLHEETPPHYCAVFSSKANLFVEKYAKKMFPSQKSRGVDATRFIFLLHCVEIVV